MSDRVIRIAAQESALVDTSAVVGLQQSLGTLRCQEMVEDAIYQITERLAKLERAEREQDYETASQIAHVLVELTNRIGLPRMSVVATDLADVLWLGDTIAISAICARLIRLGEDSLFTLVRLGGDGV